MLNSHSQKATTRDNQSFRELPLLQQIAYNANAINPNKW